jgi:heme exporter protein CcmD
MTEFWTSGHGFYIAASYVVAAIAIVAEILAVRSRRRRAIAEAQATAPDPRPPVALGPVRADR